MGGGDFKYGIFLGLAFGFPNSIVVLMLAFLLGSLVGIFLIVVNKKKFGQTIPFGPFLSLGWLIVLFWGDKIVDKKADMFKAYVSRSYFHPPYKKKPFILNTEELATIYHFPSGIETPGFTTISSRKAEPPANLPI